MKKRIVCSALRICIFLIYLSVFNILITAQAGSPAANVTTAPTYAMQMMDSCKTMAMEIGMDVQFRLDSRFSGEHFDNYIVSISSGSYNDKSCRITYFMNADNESDGNGMM